LKKEGKENKEEGKKKEIRSMHEYEGPKTRHFLKASKRLKPLYFNGKDSDISNPV